MGKCIHCKKEMEKGTKVCPHCGKKQGNALVGLIFIIIVFLVIFNLIKACVNSSSNKVLTYGELLDLKESCVEYNEDLECINTVLIIKAKIKSSYNNKATVDQNYYNVLDYINEHKDDMKKYSRFDYWAVADMTNGAESKVVSFDISSDVIQKVLDGEITTIEELSDNVDNLFILPSLK